MGYSNAVRAGWQLDTLSEVCYKSTKTSNTFKDGNTEYFFERNNNEHPDGSITGAIYEHVGDNKYRLAGSFRIEPDGTVSRGLVWMKKNAMSQCALDVKYIDTYGKQYKRA